MVDKKIKRHRFRPKWRSEDCLERLPSTSQTFKEVFPQGQGAKGQLLIRKRTYHDRRFHPHDDVYTNPITTKWMSIASNKMMQYTSPRQHIFSGVLV